MYDNVVDLSFKKFFDINADAKRSNPAKIFSIPKIVYVISNHLSAIKNY